MYEILGCFVATFQGGWFGKYYLSIKTHNFSYSTYSALDKAISIKSIGDKKAKALPLRDWIKRQC